MTFDLHQLDNLDFDDSNELVDDYIQDAIQAFADSPEGQAYSEEHPDFGGWIRSFYRLQLQLRGIHFCQK